MIAKLQQELERRMGPGEAAAGFFAPGRVNLIGEYTDFNGGHVFPCALTIGTYGVARRRGDRRIRLYSLNFAEDGIYETSLDELIYRDIDGWSNYAKGVVWAFREKGYAIPAGFDFLCYGNIPNQSGLSSSASLEVLVSKVLIELFGLPVEMVEAALISQYAENRFVGVNCGIMDQFAIANGKQGHAVFLDTETLSYRHVPVRLDGVSIVIGNTKKKRGLHDSKYNERRRECEQALQDLQQVCRIRTLGDLTEAAFEEAAHVIHEENCRRRARHAVYENQRTLQAVKALQEQDIATFGRLLNASHISLRDDFEVTGPELDAMVEAAWKQPGVLGARMTGAGFGGCTVNLVETAAVPGFIEQVGRMYEEAVGYPGEFYVVEIGDGAKRI